MATKLQNLGHQRLELSQDHQVKIHTALSGESLYQSSYYVMKLMNDVHVYSGFQTYDETSHHF